MRLRTDDLVWREIDGETVLLDLRTSRYLTTNRVGSYLVQLLATDQDQETLVSALVERYGIGREIAEKDAAAFVGTLRERELLA